MTTIPQATSIKKRDSNLELLRIIAMLLIIAHHYVVSSGLTAPDGPIYTNPLSTHALFLLILGAWGKIGINCFVLITGYFMCKSEITTRKFLKLLCEVMFYQIVIASIFWIFGSSPFTLKDFITTSLPITHIGTNFVSAFLLFFLFIPFLNILIQQITHKQHFLLLVLCFFTYVLLGTFHAIDFNYISWFIILYFLSSYLRLYPKKIYTNNTFWGIMLGSSVFISILSVIAGAWLSSKFGPGKAYAFVADSNTFLATLTGLSVFLFFKNLHISYHRFINIFAASSFGVLLIHNDKHLRLWLWNDVFDVVHNQTTAFGYAHIFITIIAIYLCCSAIDMLRLHFIEKPCFVLWDKKWPSFSQKLANFNDSLFQKLGVEDRTNDTSETTSPTSDTSSQCTK